MVRAAFELEQVIFTMPLEWVETEEACGCRRRLQEPRRFPPGVNLANAVLALAKLRADMKSCAIFIAAILSGGIPGLLQAADPAPELRTELARVCAGELLRFPLPPLDLFDEDADRLISRDEAASCSTLARMFSRLDLDASGMLTAAEYDGFPDLWRRRVITLRDEASDDDD